jgi:hypothetical protein
MKMEFIDDIRRKNLSALAAEVGGAATLSRLLEREESQVSQWINGSPLPSGKKRGMRSATARWIEERTGKRQGWLDERHDAAAAYTVTGPIQAAYADKPPSARLLEQTLLNLAEQINDDGLRELIGFARCLTGTHPQAKKQAA